MRMNKSPAKEIASAVIQGKSVDLNISLDVLAEINRILAARTDSNRMRSLVVIYGIKAKKAVVTYPLLSKTRLNVVSDTPLHQKNFTLILHEPEIIGNTLPSSLKERINDDRSTLIIATVIFFVAFALIVSLSHNSAVQYTDYLSNPDAHPKVQNVLRLYEVIGQSLLTVMTLFLTVFVLFTISQNADIGKDSNLFTGGLFHKFIRDDQFITAASAIALLTASLGLLFATAPSEIYSWTIRGVIINKLNSLVPLLYSVATATFYISLTSLSYYSKRVIAVNESNLLKEILDKREEQAKNQRKALAEQENNSKSTNGS